MYSEVGLRCESGTRVADPDIPVVPSQADPIRYKSLSAQIESLSGVFSGAVQEAQDHLVTNDRGMEHILPMVRERLQRQPGGVGVFIGSAALASLAPDSRLNALVGVDVNEAVLGFNGRLNRAIVTEVAVLSTLRDQASVCSHIARALNHGTPTGYKSGYIEEELLSEASRFGSEHWSNPARAGAVAEALKQREPTYVAADLSNRNFITALGAICRQQRQLITFANFTNVHEWIEGSDMSYLRALPFDANATVMYSIDDGEPLQARLAYSLDEYIQATQNSWDSMMAGVDWSI